MPSARNLFRVRFVWLLRATALRRWCHAIFLAALASSFSSARGDDKPQDRTSAAMAVCTWQTVSSGFSPPLFLSHPRQEQVAHRRQNQVAFQSQVAAAFVLIQADPALLVLETTFHTPARERHQKQDLDAGLRGCAAHEEFQLAGIKDVSGHQQVKGLSRQAVISFDGQHYSFAFPDHWPLLTVLDSETLPRLVPQSWIVQPTIDPAGRWASAGQAGDSTAASPTVAVVGPGDDTRRIKPTSEAPRYLGDIPLATRRQFAEQFGLAAIAFVERQPIKAEPVANGVVIQLQGDLPLGPISHSVGNPSFATAVAIGIPAFGEVQLAIEEAVEILTCEAQVDGNNAVLGFAQPTTPLLLDAGRLVTHFRVTGFVEGSNNVETLLVSGDELLEPFAQAILSPPVLAEKLLQRARRNVRVECNRLHALFRQVRKLTSDVHTQVRARALTTETVVKEIDVLGELRLQPTNLVD